MTHFLILLPLVWLSCAYLGLWYVEWSDSYWGHLAKENLVMCGIFGPLMLAVIAVDLLERWKENGE